jgi:hypothetical protein
VAVVVVAHNQAQDQEEMVVQEVVEMEQYQLQTLEVLELSIQVAVVVAVQTEHQLLMEVLEVQE